MDNCSFLKKLDQSVEKFDLAVSLIFFVKNCVRDSSLFILEISHATLLFFNRRSSDRSFAIDYDGNAEYCKCIYALLIFFPN